MNDLTLEENFLLTMSATLVDKKPNELLKSGGLFGATAILSAHLTQLGETGAYPVLQNAIRVAYEKVKEQDTPDEIKQLTNKLKETNEKCELALAHQTALWIGIVTAFVVGLMIGVLIH